MLNLLPDVEDQMLGVRSLPLFAIDETADAQPMRIAQLVSSDDPRTHWGMGVKALAEGPLRGGVLGHPLGHIIADAIAEHGGGCFGGRDMLAARADHRDQFGFVIVGEGTARDQDWIIRTVDAGLGLGEPHLLFRGAHLRFFDVVGVVEADRKDLARALDRRFQLD